jgi:hypothetical protein
MTIVTGLLGVAVFWWKRDDATREKRSAEFRKEVLDKVAALEKHVISDLLAHQALEHAIESNADRSDHQDTLLSVALGGKVSTATVRAAGIKLDSEPPSSPMLMRPRMPSRGRFGE